MKIDLYRVTIIVVVEFDSINSLKSYESQIPLKQFMQCTLSNVYLWKDTDIVDYG